MIQAHVSRKAVSGHPRTYVGTTNLRRRAHTSGMRVALPKGRACSSFLFLFSFFVSRAPLTLARSLTCRLRQKGGG